LEEVGWGGGGVGWGGPQPLRRLRGRESRPVAGTSDPSSPADARTAATARASGATFRYRRTHPWPLSGDEATSTSFQKAIIHRLMKQRANVYLPTHPWRFSGDEARCKHAGQRQRRAAPATNARPVHAETTNARPVLCRDRSRATCKRRDRDQGLLLAPTQQKRFGVFR
jgi:hypothetical protein